MAAPTSLGHCLRLLLFHALRHAHLLVVSAVFVCPLVNTLQCCLMQLGCHVGRARQWPRGLGAHSMLQDLWQVLSREVPEQVAAMKQLVADLHSMEPHLHISEESEL